MTVRFRNALVSAAALLLAAPALAQQAPPADHQEHHPPGATAPAPPPPPALSGGMGGRAAGMPGGMMGRGPGGGMGMGRDGGMMGMGPGGGMMGQMMPMMGPRHVEGRLAFLKAELKITDAQAAQWNAFADAVRANAKAHDDLHGSMMKPDQAAALPEKLAAHEKMMSEHAAGLARARQALEPLYAVLSPEQKKLADELVSPMMLM